MLAFGRPMVCAPIPILWVCVSLMFTVYYCFRMLAIFFRTSGGWKTLANVECSLLVVQWFVLLFRLSEFVFRLCLQGVIASGCLWFFGGFLVKNTLGECRMLAFGRSMVCSPISIVWVCVSLLFTVCYCFRMLVIFWWFFVIFGGEPLGECRMLAFGRPIVCAPISGTLLPNFVSRTLSPQSLHPSDSASFWIQIQRLNALSLAKERSGLQNPSSAMVSVWYEIASPSLLCMRIGLRLSVCYCFRMLVGFLWFWCRKPLANVECSLLVVQTFMLPSLVPCSEFRLPYSISSNSSSIRFCQLLNSNPEIECP